MGYKMKRGTTPEFKELGSSPAKQVKGDFNKTGSGAAKVFVEEVRTLAEIKKPDDTTARQLASKKLNKAFNKKRRTKAVKKVATKIGGKFLGPIGTGLIVKDAYGTYKDVKKGMKITKALKKNFLGIE